MVIELTSVYLFRLLQKSAFVIAFAIFSVAADVSHLKQGQGYDYPKPEKQGYDYPKPAIPFELPTQPAPTYLPPDTTTIRTSNEGTIFDQAKWLILNIIF